MTAKGLSLLVAISGSGYCLYKFANFNHDNVCKEQPPFSRYIFVKRLYVSLHAYFFIDILL